MHLRDTYFNVSFRCRMCCYVIGLVCAYMVNSSRNRYILRHYDGVVDRTTISCSVAHDKPCSVILQKFYKLFELHFSHATIYII